MSLANFDVVELVAEYRRAHGMQPEQSEAPTTGRRSRGRGLPLERILIAEPTPCDGCRHAARCAKGEACEAFRAFAKGQSKAGWAPKPRQPRPEIFERVFREPAREAA